VEHHAGIWLSLCRNEFEHLITAGTAIDGTFAQDVAGISVYAMWNESIYGELGAYHSAKQGASNSITGAAALWTGRLQMLLTVLHRTIVSRMRGCGADIHWRSAFMDGSEAVSGRSPGASFH